MLSHKNTLRLCTWFGACLSLFYPASVFAQGALEIFDANTFIAGFVVKIITVLNMLTWVLFAFLNFLLSPSFMFDLDASGADGTFMNMLNSIWQLSRDLTNMAFAVILVFGAVYTIITANGKEMIVQNSKKFVIALVLVNFSWFIPRVVLDVANVATSAIYGIPSLLANSNQKCQYTSGVKEEFCTEKTPGVYTCDCVIVTNIKMFVDNYRDLRTPWKCPANELMCYKVEKLDGNTVAGYSAILNGLIINHGRLRELGRVPKKIEGATNVSALVIFIIREMIILVIHIALFFPLLAMVAAFFIRIPILWATMSFMPFAVLQYFLSDSITDGWPKKIMDNFIKAAFLPAMVAVPLSIGFIMINAGSQIVPAAGSPLAGISGISARVFDGVPSLFEFMWMGMSIGVMWIGVFDVLKKGPGPIAGIAGTIQNAGQSMATSAAVGAGSKIPMPFTGGSVSDFAAKFKGDGNPFNNGPKDASPGDATKAAKAIKADPAKLSSLNTHMDKLRDAIRAGNKKDKDRAIGKINQAVGFNAVGSKNPEKDLEQLLKKMEDESIRGIEMNKFKTKVGEVKTETDTRRTADPKFFAAASGPIAQPFSLPPNLGGQPPVAPTSGLAGTVPPQTPPTSPAAPGAPQMPPAGGLAGTTPPPMPPAGGAIPPLGPGPAGVPPSTPTA